MSTPDMTTILEQLAAGRIDAAEAARRIDAMKAAEYAQDSPEPAGAEPNLAPEPTDVSEAPAATAEPTKEELAAAGPTDQDPWAAETDRPQHASHRTESFLPPPRPQ